MQAGVLASFRPVSAGLVAHQGGWDEILLIGGPMLAIAILLAIAKRRVDAAARANEPSESNDVTAGDDPS